MDDAWRELWDGGAGQPYSAVVFKSSTTNDNRNLVSLTILLVHYRTRFISVASENSVRWAYCVLRYDWPEPQPRGSRVCTVGCAAIEQQSTSLTSHPCTCSWIGFICAKCLENAHIPLNMVNEPGKMPNLNTVICKVYVHRRKNSRAKNKENLDSPSILRISLSKAWNFLGDGSIYVGRAWQHKPNLLKFLPRHGEVIPWHHARRHVFQAFISFFSIVENPINKRLWLTIATHFIEISVHSL